MLSRLSTGNKSECQGFLNHFIISFSPFTQMSPESSVFLKWEFICPHTTSTAHITPNYLLPSPFSHILFLLILLDLILVASPSTSPLAAKISVTPVYATAFSYDVLFKYYHIFCMMKCSSDHASKAP